MDDTIIRAKTKNTGNTSGNSGKPKTESGKETAAPIKPVQNINRGAGSKKPDEEKPEKKVELKPNIPVLQWEALEYEYTPKSNNWFWSVAIIAASIALASALFGNFLFSVLIVVAAFTVIVYGARKPKKAAFSFTARGIQIDNRLFPYENLRSFWLHYEPPFKKFLTVEPKRMLMPTITIPLDDTDPNTVRDFLLKFLKEERREESLITTITRLLGF